MQTQPASEAFAAVYAAGRPQVVWTTLVADLETPVSAMLKLAEGRPNSFLFESVEGGAVRGRYSLIGLKPDLIWRCRRGKAEINRRARTDSAAFEPVVGDALQSLRRLVAECRIEAPAGLPPMAAGLFGYLGYDMVRLMERLPDENPDVLGVPEAVLLRPTVVAIFDNVDDVVTVVTPAWSTPGVNARAAYNQACERLADVVADFDRTLPLRRDTDGDIAELPEPTSNMTRAQYHAMVAKAKEYIFAGDIFQVVPSQRFKVPFRRPPFALYRSLRRLNPSPFLFFLDFDGFAVVGSSPEILVRLRDGRVEHFRLPEGVGREAVLALHESRDGALWIALDNARLFRLQGGRISEHTPIGAPRDWKVRGMFEAEDGLVFLVAAGGLARLEGRRLVPLHPDGPKVRYPHMAYRDAHGALWICDLRGLVRLQRGR